jgi:hypothetical protein
MLLIVDGARFACATGLVAVLLIRVLYQIVSSLSSGIPGPLLARVSRLWLFYETYRGTLHLTLIELHSRLGMTSTIIRQGLKLWQKS